MSKAALLRGAQKRLRATFDDPSGKRIGIQPTGQPPPFAGQWYIAIHPGARSNSDTNPLSLEERYDLGVTVTVRMGYAPKDRQGERVLLDAPDGILHLADRIRADLHGNYDVLIEANTLIGDESNGFVEPLSFQSDSVIQEKPASWVWADDDENPPTTFAVEMKFGGALRVQTLESQT